MNTTELKALAEKATPGEWEVGKGLGDQSRHIYCVNPVNDGEEQWFPLIASTDDAETLVNFEANATYIAAANPAAILELITQLEDAQGEIRALRATEAGLRDRLAALEKAIMDAEPVAQIRMSDGGLSVVNRVTTKGVQVSVHRTDGDWTPLYTLNGIKK